MCPQTNGTIHILVPALDVVLVPIPHKPLLEGKKKTNPSLLLEQTDSTEQVPLKTQSLNSSITQGAPLDFCSARTKNTTQTLQEISFHLEKQANHPVCWAKYRAAGTEGTCLG